MSNVIRDDSAVSERARALHLLQRIEKESLYASLLLIGESGFVRTLVLGVLRWRSRLDTAIALLAKRSVSRIDDAVVAVLRLGLYQLLYMNVPAYAAVSESVDLAPKRARGFVNAILRGALRTTLPEPADAPSRTAHPAWLLARWSAMYGQERAERIADANQELSYPDVLSLRGSAPPDATPSTLVEGLFRLRGSSAELPRDDFYPMDEGSAVIAAIARACGQQVLDLAAAPGGKALFLAHAGARVVASDVSLPRMMPLRARGIPLAIADGRNAPFAPGSFEVVLLDAPCSATGTLRKSPELKWRLRENDLAGFARLQKELLASAMTMARSWVVYSTCSLEREENDAVVAGYDRADITPFVPEGARSWVQDGVLRLTPEAGTDGFTAFVLKPRARV